MKFAILINLVVFMVASSAADLEPQVDLTNATVSNKTLDSASVTLSVSNDTVMVESDSGSESAKEVLESPVAVEASKYAALWKIVVALGTLAITWGATKIPNIPSRIIPVLTPIIGVVFAYGLEYVNGLNLPWWDGAAAGGLAVLIQQTWKHNVTVPIEEKKAHEAMDRISRASPTDNPK